jgi:predicted DNA-binding transcriptional regulator AlpA
VNQVKQKAALAFQKDPSLSIREICAIVGISRNTYYKYIARVQEQLPCPPPPALRRRKSQTEC